MKFKFKTQPYQQDAVSNICRVFKGQPYHDMVRYTRDLGIKKKNDGMTQSSIFDAFEENDDGFDFFDGGKKQDGTVDNSDYILGLNKPKENQQMKYIRTKDSICEVCKETENGFNINKKPFLETTKTKYYLNPLIPKERVIKQANTIEELCDEFVAIHKKFAKTQCIRKVPFEKQDENFNIYGAIWTDKGLIYVAKMNDKGELELL